MVMRKLLEVERFDERRSASKERSQNYEDVLIVGQPVQISLKKLAPSQTKLIILNTSGEVELFTSTDQIVSTQTPLSLEQFPEINLLSRTFSDQIKDRSLQISFQDDNGRQLSLVKLKLTVVRVCLDIDADRDGVIDEDNPQKADWKWGINGHGAVLLVNSDRDIVYSNQEDDDTKRLIKGLLDLKDFSFMIVRKTGLRDLPSGYELYLSVNKDIGKKIRIYDELDRDSYELIGPGRIRAKIRDTNRDILLAIEGLSYPQPFTQKWWEVEPTFLK